MLFIILSNVFLSVCGCIATIWLLPGFREMFIRANLFGFDMGSSSKRKIPESQGMISGCVFLIVCFLSIPIPFSQYVGKSAESFPHSQFVEYIAALLSICCMLFLGFADDVLDLRWRHKLFLPTIASLPLLMVYYVNFNSTTIIVPKPLRPFIGMDVNLGILYYIYMGMLAVFCTNAINILAGINGLEVGQSVVIALSIIAFNFIELFGDCAQAHLLSLQFLFPYVGTSLALLFYNWYPASIFIGDTFCYFSGMLFAVVGILGHFSKTVLLFFIPQVFNFIYSTPQLFRLVPCPRHRLPEYNPKDNRRYMSYTQFKRSDVHPLGWFAISLFRTFWLLEVQEGVGEDGQYIRCNNMTLINLMLKIFGPMRELTLTVVLLIIQVSCSLVAFAIRYQLASYFYDMK